MRRRCRGRALGSNLAEPLEGRVLLSAGPIEDINASPVNAAPSLLAAINSGPAAGTLVFALNKRLWKSNGTDAGTVPLSTVVSEPSRMVDVNGTLYFRGVDAGGAELWKTNGTPAGTVRVRDIVSGAAGSNPAHLTNVNGTLYFVATDPSTGTELWKTDGTSAGTVRVKDIRPGPASGGPQGLTNVNGTLYFRADNGVNGAELWRSDGTVGGTVMVKDVNPGPRPSGASNFAAVGPAGSRVFLFAAEDGAGGYELWRSDGTAGGTVPVKNINPAPGAGSSPVMLTSVNGTVFFNANDGSTGWELWKSDGTFNGTVQVKDIVPGAGSSSIDMLTASGGRLYFAASDPAAGMELWASDGSFNGTARVKDVRGGPGGAQPNQLIDVNGTLYFRASNINGNPEVWRTDGAAGAVTVKEIVAGAGSSLPWFFTKAGNSLYFSVFGGGAAAVGLWKTDGSPDGTVRVKQWPNGTAGSGAASTFAFNNRLYFSANDGVSGVELWTSDGTAGGTKLLRDLLPGPGSSNPRGFINVNGTMYFGAANQLWRSDGTAAGTEQLSFGLQGLDSLTNVNGTVFFRGFQPHTGTELWKSDGTPGGTFRLSDIRPFAGHPLLDQLTAMNGKLYFVADDGARGQELWQSDGTPQGTVIVKDILPGAAGSGPWDLEAVGNTLFFRATNGTSGWELWKSNGTAAGTVMVKDIAAGSANSQIAYMTAAGGKLFFTASANGRGHELWASDGSSGGTVMLKDIMPGAGSASPTALTEMNGLLYFCADGPSGRELYKSDGTPAGTVLLKDIQPGAGSSAPFAFSASTGRILFVANDGAHAHELWQTDGTAAGTLRVLGATHPGLAVYNFVRVGDSVFFGAADASRGNELWRADLLNPGSAAAVAPLAGNEFFDTFFDAPPQPDSAAAGDTGTAGWAGSGLPLRNPDPTPSITGVAAATAGFPLFDSTYHMDRPGHLASGMSAVHVAMGELRPFFDQVTYYEPAIRAAARKAAAAGGPLVLDVENLPLDPRATADGEIQVTIEKFIQMVDWAHNEAPGLKVGFFSALPLHEYHVLVSGSAEAKAAWRAASERLAPIAAKVDFIAPGLYTFYEDRAGWLAYARAKVEQARRYNKPVYPFIWMNYHNGGDADLAFRAMPADFWQFQLETLRDLADGAVVWGGDAEHWDERAAWWAVTREFLDPPAPATAAVVGRQVFYNRSAFDGNSGSASAADDAAVATDKRALLPGGTATFANYTSYSRGINGIMVDIAGLPANAALAAGDFTFKVGNDNNPSGWSNAPAPASIAVRRGAGANGSDRVTIIWADGAVKKTWLQVTVKATANTGLTAADVFYFGNAIGESGNTTADAKVTPVDELAARANASAAATVTSRWDYNRDKTISGADQLTARSNQTTAFNALRLITVPAGQAAVSGGSAISRVRAPVLLFSYPSITRARAAADELTESERD
jgi:ELWxxDGT repeat protein